MLQGRRRFSVAQTKIWDASVKSLAFRQNVDSLDLNMLFARNNNKPIRS